MDRSPRARWWNSNSRATSPRPMHPRICTRGTGGQQERVPVFHGLAGHVDVPEPSEARPRHNPKTHCTDRWSSKTPTAIFAVYRVRRCGTSTISTTTLAASIEKVNLDAGTLGKFLLPRRHAVSDPGRPSSRRGPLRHARRRHGVPRHATLGDRGSATRSEASSFLRPKRRELEGRAQLVWRGKDVCHVSGELWRSSRLSASAVATRMVGCGARLRPRLAVRQKDHQRA